MRHLFSVRFFLLVWLVVVALSGFATAGTISIQTKTSVSVTDDSVSIQVEVTNQGDSQAHDVQVTVVILKEELKSRIVKQLGVKGTESFRFSQQIPKNLNGRYPLGIIVDFHDAKQYPFSAISGMTYHIREDVNSQLIFQAQDPVIPYADDTGEFNINIRNVADVERKIRVKLLIPKELSVSDNPMEIVIPARGQKDLFFEIRNFSAQAGASYPLFCYLEYEAEKKHYTTVGNATALIAAEKNWFRDTRLLWLVIAVLLAGMVVFYQIRKK